MIRQIIAPNKKANGLAFVKVNTNINPTPITSKMSKGIIF